MDLGKFGPRGRTQVENLLRIPIILLPAIRGRVGGKLRSKPEMNDASERGSARHRRKCWIEENAVRYTLSMDFRT